MKLYEVPNNSYIKVKGNITVPLDAPFIPEGETLRFFHIDGMYSLCVNKENQIVHLGASTEVEIIKEIT